MRILGGIRGWVFVCLVFCLEAQGGVYRAKYVANGKYLMVEVLSDTLLHFEISAKLPGPNEDQPIPTTPMVIQKNFPGPTSVRRNRKGLETKVLSVQVAEDTLCVRIQDRVKKLTLTEVCPHHLDQFWKGLTVARGNTRNLYGLGQEFRDPGVIDGDWIGRVRHYGGLHGNKMVHFNGGDNGNTQIPVLYGLGDGMDGFALFLDQIYQQQWDFGSTPWTVDMYGDQVRWYFASGPSLPSLRKTYMNLVGKPPVPPRKAFGLWVSEYGYRNWEHMESRLSTLRQNHFPIDGFFLDLYWFGGIQSDSDNTSMGRLAWDTRNFPDPEKKLAKLRDEQSIGIVPIEESYIGRSLPEHEELSKRGYLVKDAKGSTAYLSTHGWWGRGGMMDWTNPATNDFWHHWKRVPLIKAGISGHWLDLGEPEIYPADGSYHGGRQADVHNIYNLKWAEGVYQGYAKYTPEKRPFILSRSGTAGIQRYGVAMWSGDIGSDLSSLASHQNVQMHMSLSGVDYYGADIGGFHREGLHGDLNEMYTQWFAYGMQYDIPGRPHTENLCLCRETAPDRIGDKRSNLESLRLRYRLIPYIYSLAHEAHLNAEPVFAPPVYFYQDDLNVRTMARQKMIGPSLLGVVVARAGQNNTSVYLPKGKWWDFHTGDVWQSRGQKFPELSLYVDGRFRLPLFAKAGAIVPMMYVDEKTMDSSGRRTDGSVRNELMVKAFRGEGKSAFTLYEDDGISTSYLRGAVRKTLLTQSDQGGEYTFTIARPSGDYDGAPDERNNIVEIHMDAPVRDVRFNGKALPGHANYQDWEKHDCGWFIDGKNRLYLKTGTMSVEEEKTFSVYKKS